MLDRVTELDSHTTIVCGAVDVGSVVIPTETERDDGGDGRASDVVWNSLECVSVVCGI